MILNVCSCGGRILINPTVDQLERLLKNKNNKIHYHPNPQNEEMPVFYYPDQYNYEVYNLIETIRRN